MSEWKKPEFSEIRMDAEINCYSSVLEENGAIRMPHQPVLDEQPTPQTERR